MRWIVSRERPEGWALPLPLLGDDVENRYEKAQGSALGQWFVPPLPKQGNRGGMPFLLHAHLHTIEDVDAGAKATNIVERAVLANQLTVDAVDAAGLGHLVDDMLNGVGVDFTLYLDNQVVAAGGICLGGAEVEIGCVFIHVACAVGSFLAEGTLGTAQLQWLRELLTTNHLPLTTNHPFRHTIVFTHTHLFKRDNSQGHTSNYAIEETYELTSLLEQGGVDMYWCGHDHSREITDYAGFTSIVVDAIEDHYPPAFYMIADLSDAIRPYLKAFYNGARDLPEMSKLSKEMTPYEEVGNFDVANFDKNTVDALASAETIVKEEEVAEQVEEAKERIKNTVKSSKSKEKPVSLQDI